MRIILISYAVASVGAGTPQTQDPAPTVRRIATITRLAADEYRLGVSDGRIKLQAEIDEAKLFLREARQAAGALPASRASVTALAIDSILAAVGRTADPDSVAGSVERLVSTLSTNLHVTLDELPGDPPSLARGETIYRGVCAACHGAQGRSDGPASVGMQPPPANLADPEALKTASPLDFYRRVTIGVAGTSMGGYEGSLSPRDRWAVALYASMLRLPPSGGTPPPALQSFRTTLAMSDAAVAQSLGDGDPALIAAVRKAAGGLDRKDFASVLAAVRRSLDSSFELARAGRSAEARGTALDAYLGFEAVERELRVKDPSLVTELEAGFARARERTEPEEAASNRARLFAGLDRAERALGTSLSPLTLFVQSLVILLREGLEAILVVGALLTFLAKLGAAARRREVHLGVLAAVVSSLITAVAIETVFRIGPAHQEALEAVTMVVATVMLFYVSYWLLSKIEVARWNQFVKSKLSDALSNRSTFALASVAFLAVYREGFETVLFYKALAVSEGATVTALPITLGILVGALGLAVVYVAIHRFGVRLPLRPFFAVTSAFLYFMAMSFAGTAIAELQEGGFVPITPVAWMARLPAVGLYPTVESMAAQGLLLALAIAALVWTFVVLPRRAAPIAVQERSPAGQVGSGRRVRRARKAVR